MKRILLLAAVAALVMTFQMLVNCSSPLEGINENDDPTPNPPPVDTIDTVYLTDTIIVIDSTGGYDTIIVEDTIIRVDTIMVTDTIWDGDTIVVVDTFVDFDTIVVIDTSVAWDTIVVVDTMIVIDTTVVTDTVQVPDTIFVPDTIIWTDTVIQNDTTIQYDTVVVTDTVETPDTVYVPDTVVIPDTIFITDTVTVVDTIYVEVPDTSDSPVMCARMGATQKEIVWMLRNVEGEYHLEFSGRVEKEHPSNTVIVDINGHDYTWDVSAEPVLVIDKWLAANTVIVIERTKPNPFGHGIDICLTISQP